MNLLTEKLIEVTQSVIPTILIVLLIHFFVIPLPMNSLVSFIIGTLVVVIGLTIFLTGIDLSITPIGEYMGKGIAKSNRLWVVILGGFILGFVISAAEPSLIVLGDQIQTVTDGLVSSVEIVVVVSIGLGIMVSIGLMRIFFSWSLRTILLTSYGLIFILALFTSTEFLSIAFDASGATTGAITVPFMLALSAGVASMKRNTQSSEEDSFGLVAIASIGAIISVMLYNIFVPVDELSGSLEVSIGPSTSIVVNFINHFTTQLIEVFFTVLPIVVLFYLYQFTLLKLSRRRLNRITFGIVFVYIGLVLFLTGVNAGFMDLGSLIGYTIANEEMYIWLAIVGMLLGIVTILAEPAVAVLTQQIEDVTSGAIRRLPVLVALTAGVGIAILFATLRLIFPAFQLWHVLLPGYVIALGLTFIVPKVFIGMAFDAGGVATGPITATFILAFIQGAAEGTTQASILIDGFGMIALVALMPILTLQILGLVFELKRRRHDQEEEELGKTAERYQ